MKPGPSDNSGDSRSGRHPECAPARSWGPAMRIAVSLLVTLSLAGAGCNGQPKRAPLAQADNDLACDLYGQLRDRDANLIFSPTTVAAALALTYAGARGDTADELCHVARFALPPDRLAASFGELFRELEPKERSAKYQLTVANALWLQQGYPFNPTFEALSRDHFRAELKSTDFARPDAARRAINDWVNRSTKHKIAGIIPAGQLTRDSRLVVTNALYLRATWAVNFPETDTRSDDFWRADGQPVKTPMMRRHAGDLALYSEFSDCQILQLPLTSRSRLMFCVLLPKRRDGLADLERSLTGPRLDQLLKPQAGKYEIDIALPRFRVEAGYDLVPALRALGVRRALDPDADFSGLANVRPLWLSALAHQAMIDVTEVGVEAAAAAGGEIIGADDDEIPRRVTFRADHPFVFLIRHGPTRRILFLGRLVDPTARAGPAGA